MLYINNEKTEHVKFFTFKSAICKACQSSLYTHDVQNEVCNMKCIMYAA